MVTQSTRTTRQSLHEYGRGIAGGLLFSLPLLFTQEVWWAGLLLSPARLLAFVIFIFALLLLYNRFAGLRHADVTWTECAVDSIEELGIGLVLAALVLWLLGQLNGANLNEIFPRILVEGLIVAIGVSVGTAQFGGSDDDEADDNEEVQKRGESFLSQQAIALCGAALFVSNLAPTEEILVVATSASGLQLFLMAVCSIVGGGYVLYFSEFHGSQSSFAEGGFGELVIGATTSYAVALLAAAALLYFFGRLDGQSFSTNFAQIVTAGLAASLGASAGRLLLQVNPNAR